MISRPVVLTLQCVSEPPGRTGKHRFWAPLPVFHIQKVWGRDCKFAFLNSSQVTLLLLSRDHTWRTNDLVNIFFLFIMIKVGIGGKQTLKHGNMIYYILNRNRNFWSLKLKEKKEKRRSWHKENLQQEKCKTYRWSSPRFSKLLLRRARK